MEETAGFLGRIPFRRKDRDKGWMKRKTPVPPEKDRRFGK
jgi:hypothetical protein